MNHLVSAKNNRRDVLLSGGAVIAPFMILDPISWTQGGGLLSIISAYSASQARAAVIDTDTAGLRAVFILACATAATALFLAIGWPTKDRWRSLLFLLIVVGGGFLLDLVFDQRLVGSYMAAEGYSHCAAGDHAVGAGKGRIWFRNYVLTAADCRPHSAKLDFPA